eukprot:6178662-Pleurochrysis_carterae.AAC.6
MRKQLCRRQLLASFRPGNRLVAPPSPNTRTLFFSFSAPAFAVLLLSSVASSASACVAVFQQAADSHFSKLVVQHVDEGLGELSIAAARASSSLRCRAS